MKKKKKILLFHRYLYFTHDVKLEIIWTIIPILFVLEIIYPSLSLIASEDRNNKGSFYTVSVLGNQWYWIYEINLALGVLKYVSNLVLLEEGNRSHNNLTRLLVTTTAIPIVAGIKTAFYITSNDVNHSWALPSLGIKVDAIPGRINLKTIIASRLGLYTGMCSELCGVEHGFMPISVQVLTFSKWWLNVKETLENVKIYYYNNICFYKIILNIDLQKHYKILDKDLEESKDFNEKNLEEFKDFNEKNLEESKDFNEENSIEEISSYSKNLEKFKSSCKECKVLNVKKK